MLSGFALFAAAPGFTSPALFRIQKNCQIRKSRRVPLGSPKAKVCFGEAQIRKLHRVLQLSTKRSEAMRSNAEQCESKSKSTAKGTTEQSNRKPIAKQKQINAANRAKLGIVFRMLQIQSTGRAKQTQCKATQRRSTAQRQHRQTYLTRNESKRASKQNGATRSKSNMKATT